MIIERFEDAGLAQYSYLIGCPAAGTAAVIDPRRDCDVYIDYAAANGYKIRHVLETHIHADFASGALELAERVGVKPELSGYDEGEDFEVGFEHADLKEGDSITFGSVRIEPVHTPGHTPEHLSYVVYDLARSESTPMAMLTGDFLFVGSLGRPDLLGEDMEADLANQLFDTVRKKLPPLPDSLEIMPGHGAGSMCGSGMAGTPTSTLGYERATNPYLRPDLTREDFVAEILGSAPPFPDYYRRMKRVNSEGPRVLGQLPGMKDLGAAAVEEHLAAGGVVVDLRHEFSFGGGHIPESFGIGLRRPFSMWAAWVVPYDTPIVLVGEDRSGIAEAVRGLIRVGLDDVVGHLKGGIRAWVSQGRPISATPFVGVNAAHSAIGAAEGPVVLDVREDSEMAQGRIEGSIQIPAGRLSERLDELPADREIVVMCGNGYRSTVAASVLERAGIPGAQVIAGGIGAWRAADLPLTE